VSTPLRKIPSRQAAPVLKVRVAAVSNQLHGTVGLARGAGPVEGRGSIINTASVARAHSIDGDGRAVEPKQCLQDVQEAASCCLHERIAAVAARDVRVGSALKQELNCSVLVLNTCTDQRGRLGLISLVIYVTNSLVHYRRPTTVQQLAHPLTVAVFCCGVEEFSR
jgi:hypothetical protein